MADPISFTSTSPRFGLPFLFSGQSQKEFYVNQAHALADALLHAVVEGVANSPPASPAAGECWIVGDAPTGPWTGHARSLAAFEAGTWLYAAPQDGMQIYDKAAGQRATFAGGWQRAVSVAPPAGGTTVDTQARTAIGQLVAALVSAGILADT